VSVVTLGTGGGVLLGRLWLRYKKE